VKIYHAVGARHYPNEAASNVKSQPCAAKPFVIFTADEAPGQKLEVVKPDSAQRSLQVVDIPRKRWKAGRAWLKTLDIQASFRMTVRPDTSVVRSSSLSETNLP
jgi:hypothetical protein